MTNIFMNFFFKKHLSRKMKDFPEMPSIEGLEISAASANLYNKDRDDVCLFYFSDGAIFSGVYTKSTTRSVCIDWNVKADKNKIRYLLVNTRNANAFTGNQGKKSLIDLTKFFISQKKIKKNQILYASTGVIGQPFPLEKIKSVLPNLLEKLNRPVKISWLKQALSIMTTDTFAKMSCAVVPAGNDFINISGIAKGSGMIAPNMATMFGFIFTDANITQDVLTKILKKNVATTFNAITVDGDTSTNDMVLVFSTRKSKNRIIKDVKSELAKEFDKALHTVMLDLAKQVVIDGEGAKKFLTVNVRGASNDDLAKEVAMSIANSPLVKTAVAGSDPNWGRILMAIGKTNERAKRNKIEVSIGNFLITKYGMVTPSYDEAKVKEYMNGEDIVFDINLNLGKGKFTAYTCDFNAEYISINADYRS
ncbi:MAG: bifunctional glutamate N-acetyltransferase/amino-acid acetyltransferase ArgJ [Candidatus Fonsibacter sp.]|nr:bifunctional glutamate N-acetyltransferase/amino-acid acetyltransferase ArgJ [Pelagibacterales bacterium]